MLLLTRRRNAAFDPLSLFGSGEDGFYKEITGVSGLWQDTPPSTAISASGQGVAHVDDDSGNNNDISQGAAGGEPIYTDSGGVQYLAFDGTDDEFISGNGQFEFGTVSAHFAIRKSGTGQFLISHSSAANAITKRWGIAINTSTTISTQINNTNTNGSSAIIPSGTTTDFCVGCNFATADVYVDGSFAETIGTGATITYTTANLPTYFMGQDRAGANFGGRVYAILVINRTLTAQEISDLHGYWAANLF